MPNISTKLADASTRLVTSKAIHDSSEIILLTLTCINSSFSLTIVFRLSFLFVEKVDGKTIKTFFK
jgi:hypothetical protein